VSPIAGEDSMQALTLALEFLTSTLPRRAKRAGAKIEWLGERERLVFAGTELRQQLERALEHSLTGVSLALDMLGRKVPVDPKSLRDLRELVRTGGAKWPTNRE
jgi:hypothetical protein